DLVPLVSYALLGGRCRYCHSRISPQYPLVEALAAAIAVFVALVHPSITGFFFWLLVWLTALFISVYDIRHKVIPLGAAGLLIVLGAADLFFVRPEPFVPALVAGPLLALPLLILCVVSGGRWMGLGDPILMLGLGLLLGLTAGLSAFLIAFVVGAGVGIALMLFTSGYTMKSEVPLGPFLILGAAVVHFFHVDFFSTLSILWH
ncbi:MAG: prepilin peptidase, partial [Patescibacteria group bacterium]|nr:prepilin peptidase [Patescibacteria group bacterium]